MTALKQLKITKAVATLLLVNGCFNPYLYAKRPDLEPHRAVDLGGGYCPTKRDKDGYAFSGVLETRFYKATCLKGKLWGVDIFSPAIIWADGSQEWWFDGKRDRSDNKPAVEWADGSKEWWDNGVPRRRSNNLGKAMPSIDYGENAQFYLDCSSYSHSNGDQCMPLHTWNARYCRGGISCSVSDVRINPMYVIINMGLDGHSYFFGPSGKCHNFEFACVNGLRHRTDGPAIQGVWAGTWWFINGVPHREDGPAGMTLDKSKFWYRNGYLHRENGPAVEWGNGDKQWFRNGVLHRKDGPAIQLSNGDEEYWENGRRIK